MKKRYIPAEIEKLIFSTCDLIALSPELPENPEGGGTGGETPGENPGSGVGGGYNPGGWEPIM